MVEIQTKETGLTEMGAVTSKVSTLSMEILSLYAIVFVGFFLNFHNVSYFIIKTVTYIAVIQCM